MQGTQALSDGPGRGTRVFVRVFVALLLVCGIFGIEAWPFTGFRLFSHLRSPRQSMWLAESVSDDGSARPLWFTRLPSAYRGVGLDLADPAERSAADRRGICRSLLTEARSATPGTRTVEIFRLTWNELPRNGDEPAQAPARVLVDACS